MTTQEGKKQGIWHATLVCALSGFAGLLVTRQLLPDHLYLQWVGLLVSAVSAYIFQDATGVLHGIARAWREVGGWLLHRWVNIACWTIGVANIVLTILCTTWFVPRLAFFQSPFATEWIYGGPVKLSWVFIFGFLFALIKCVVLLPTNESSRTDNTFRRFFISLPLYCTPIPLTVSMLGLQLIHICGLLATYVLPFIMLWYVVKYAPRFCRWAFKALPQFLRLCAVYIHNEQRVFYLTAAIIGWFAGRIMLNYTYTVGGQTIALGVWIGAATAGLVAHVAHRLLDARVQAWAAVFAHQNSQDE